MTAQERISAAEKRIEKAKKTMAMYEARIAKKLASIQKKHSNIKEFKYSLTWSYGWAEVQLDPEIRSVLDFTEYNSIEQTYEGFFNKEKEIKKEEELITTLKAEIEAKEQKAIAKELSERDLKAILTEAMQGFKEAWMAKMTNYYEYKYNHITSKYPEAITKVKRLSPLLSYFQPVSYIYNKKHINKTHINLYYRLNLHKERCSEIISDEANRYDTLESYMTMIDKRLKDEWQRCIDNLTTKCKAYNLDHTKLTIHEPSVTEKGFKVWIEDGKNRRIYARIIWAAKHSRLVTPHARYIITEKKLK